MLDRHLNLTPPMMKEMTSLPRDKSYTSPTCPGTSRMNNHYRHLYTPVAVKPIGFSEPTIETLPKQSFSPKSPQTLLRGFPCPNGDAVDLHQIYASLHHVIPNEERTLAWETHTVRPEGL